MLGTFSNRLAAVQYLSLVPKRTFIGIVMGGKVLEHRGLRLVEPRFWGIPKNQSEPANTLIDEQRAHSLNDLNGSSNDKSFETRKFLESQGCS